ncbi:MAG TPA: endonuclease NucS domain-containing protein, partial [Candidatus Angelobacter sp.]
NTQVAQINRVKKVEENYGDLDEHFANGTYQDVVNSLKYSTNDERANKPNPSKIKFEGNIRNNLQSYKNAVVRYRKFLNDSEFQDTPSVNKDSSENMDIPSPEESIQQRFSLERDMQAALRRNIATLDPSLKIIDDGAERAVNSGFIDITCDDGSAIVVVECKAGKADSRVIGQVLGYMGDLHEEEGGRPVRGILVAHDFDKRTKAAARVVPTLSLKRYSIEFRFTNED